MRAAPRKATEVLRSLSSSLRKYGIQEPVKEAEIIACNTLHITPAELYRDDPLILAPDLKRIYSIAENRAHRIPLQYITGSVEFCGLSIQVGPGVLIPRPETEFVVDEVLRVVRLEGLSSPEILDLGTGSGCVALALAEKLPSARVTGTDVSDVAIRYAEVNRKSLGIKNVLFLQGKFFQPVKGKRFDVLVSNPPYVRSEEIEGLQREIVEYEPRKALDGGEDGFAFYEYIFKDGLWCLKDGGYIIVEIGMGQAKDVRAMGDKHGCACMKTVKDFSGIDRVMVFQLTERELV
jgi:release factor glutamine methyltransferase